MNERMYKMRPVHNIAENYRKAVKILEDDHTLDKNDWTVLRQAVADIYSFLDTQTNAIEKGYLDD